MAAAGKKRMRVEETPAALKERLVQALEGKPDGMTEKQLQAVAGAQADILPVLQELMDRRRLELLNISPGQGRATIMVYRVIAEEVALRLQGLSAEEQAVLGIVDKANNQGVWVRNIKLQTRLQQTQINKILKKLENRKLIKAVKSVAFKNRKMYMLYDLGEWE